MHNIIIRKRIRDTCDSFFLSQNSDFRVRAPKKKHTWLEPSNPVSSQVAFWTRSV